MAHFHASIWIMFRFNIRLRRAESPGLKLLEDRGSQAYQVFLGPSQVPESPQKRVCEDRYSLEPMMRGCEHHSHQRNYRRLHTMVSCRARVLQIKLKVPLCSVNNVASRDAEPFGYAGTGLLIESRSAAAKSASEALFRRPSQVQIPEWSYRQGFPAILPWR